MRVRDFEGLPWAMQLPRGGGGLARSPAWGSLRALMLLAGRCHGPEGTWQNRSQTRCESKCRWVCGHKRQVVSLLSSPFSHLSKGAVTAPWLWTGPAAARGEPRTFPGREDGWRSEVGCGRVVAWRVENFREHSRISTFPNLHGFHCLDSRKGNCSLEGRHGILDSPACSGSLRTQGLEFPTRRRAHGGHVPPRPSGLGARGCAALCSARAGLGSDADPGSL